ncbi:MAG TPA: hypothetical protein PJ982_11990, partial [Lacipirellulaceae bacterium]|nr:hypothetical protein [Lacipirellulaceae bacterium]
MACAFVLAFIPTGVRRALQTSSVDPGQWLSPQTAEMQDLAWFHRHFGGEDYAIVSWDGCTLAHADRLNLLGKKLATSTAPGAAGIEVKLFNRVTTAPEVIDDLMALQPGLAYGAAARRLEGALVGPLPR